MYSSASGVGVLGFPQDHEPLSMVQCFALLGYVWVTHLSCASPALAAVLRSQSGYCGFYFTVLTANSTSFSPARCTIHLLGKLTSVV